MAKELDDRVTLLFQRDVAREVIILHGVVHSETIQCGHVSDGRVCTGVWHLPG